MDVNRICMQNDLDSVKIGTNVAEFNQLKCILEKIVCVKKFEEPVLQNLEDNIDTREQRKNNIIEINVKDYFQDNAQKMYSISDDNLYVFQLKNDKIVDK